MCALMILAVKPFMQVGLHRIYAVVELVTERDLIKLLQDRLLEPLADAVCLGGFHLGFGVIDVIDRQQELEVVFVDAATIFGAAIRHDPQHRQIMFIVERQHPVVEQISCRDRRLGGVELGMGHLAIDVHVGLLINRPTPLRVPT